MDILNSRGKVVAKMQGFSIYDLKGTKIYNVKAEKIYRLSGELVGHLAATSGVSTRLDSAKSYFALAEGRCEDAERRVKDTAKKNPREAGLWF